MMRNVADKIAAAEAERPAVEAQLKLAERAAAEETFSGWLRREIHRAPMHLPTIWQQSEISKTDFLDFLEGGTLTTVQVDRLCATLGISLVANS
jgi:hypothetical protein